MSFHFRMQHWNSWLNLPTVGGRRIARLLGSDRLAQRNTTPGHPNIKVQIADFHLRWDKTQWRAHFQRRSGQVTSTAVFGSSEVATIELPSPSCPSIVDYSIDIAWQSPWKLSHKCQGQQQYMRKSAKQEKLKGSYKILSEAIIAFIYGGGFGGLMAR